MIIKKIIILLSLILLFSLVFVIFFWDIPAPVKQIEKDLEIHRLKGND
tara:strand:+ start:81 stop:224 length:144 start_codon:yes stop_codon:yes gene_type:complete